MENSDSGSEATGPDSVTGSAAEISGSEIGFVPPSESDCATNASAESATTSGSPAGSSAGSECRAKFTPGSTVCSDPNLGFDSGTVSGRLGNGFRLGDRASFGDWLRLKGRPHLGKRFGLKIRTRFANSVPFGGSIRFEG